MALGTSHVAGSTRLSAGSSRGARLSEPDREACSPATSIRVLVVDDDDAVRNALRRVLQHRGYQVVASSSAADALSRLAADGFDTMVSDVRMPGMSGLGLLRAVREQDPDLPVILVTGSPDLGSATEALELGVFQYLIKPVESDRLGQLIERAATVGRAARVKRGYVEKCGSATFRVADRADGER